MTTSARVKRLGGGCPTAHNGLVLLSGLFRQAANVFPTDSTDSAERPGLTSLIDTAQKNLPSLSPK